MPRCPSRIAPSLTDWIKLVFRLKRGPRQPGCLPPWRQHSYQHADPARGWALKLGRGHVLSNPGLSDGFDGGSAVCFSYRSLVISGLLKGSTRCVLISSNPCLSSSEGASATGLWIGDSLVSYRNRATVIQDLVLKGLNLQPSD